MGRGERHGLCVQYVQSSEGMRMAGKGRVGALVPPGSAEQKGRRLSSAPSFDCVSPHLGQRIAW